MWLREIVTIVTLIVTLICNGNFELTLNYEVAMRLVAIGNPNHRTLYGTNFELIMVFFFNSQGTFLGRYVLFCVQHG